MSSDERTESADSRRRSGLAETAGRQRPRREAGLSATGARRSAGDGDRGQRQGRDDRCGTRRRGAGAVLGSAGLHRRGGLPDDADLLVTVRASTLRHHAGQAAFPGGAADPGDDGPIYTALREANEETGIDTGRLQPLATLEKMFIPPSGFHVVPVLAYSPDPGPVAVVDESETAIVARVPVRAFINPENRLMVYRKENTRRLAGPAFLLNEMLVWGFTGR